MIDEWVGGLGAPLAQWEVMRLVPPLNEEVVGPLPAYAPLFRFFLFFSFFIQWRIFLKKYLWQNAIRQRDKKERRERKGSFVFIVFLSIQIKEQGNH